MAAIKVRQSTMVRPAEPTPRHRVWLSNIDLVVSRAHARSIYFYRRPSSGTTASSAPEDFFDPAQLRESLARVLVPFYPIAGRKTKDEAGRMQIECNDEGVLFLEADSEDTVDDFGDFAPTTKLQQLIPEVDYSKGISSYPLLLLQLTYFKCGGVSLGIAMDHQLVDGLSSLHFINSWADVSRGAAGVKVAPLVDARTLLRARDPPTPRFPHMEYQPAPPSPPPSMDTTSHLNSGQVMIGNSCVPSSAGDVKIFKLTRELLNLLVKKHSPPGAAYSTYVVLAAHVWRCVCIARELQPDQETRLYIAVDGRRRLRPQLREGFMGNVIFTTTPTATAREMTSAAGNEELIRVTARIHESIIKMDDEYLRSVLDHLEVQPDLDKLASGPHQHKCPNFRFTSWAQLPVYAADFKWGMPAFMGPGCMSHEGMAYALPIPSNDGSLALAICLQPQHMLKFQKLIYEI